MTTNAPRAAQAFSPASGSRTFSRAAPKGLHCALACLLAAACSSQPKQQAAAPPAPSTSQQVPIGQLPTVDTNALLAHTKVLSSDEYEGRAPGTKGEDLTVAYLEREFKNAGLKPGNTDGTYVQKVPLVGITPSPAPMSIKAPGGKSLSLKWKDDIVAWTKHVADTASIKDSELVF